MLNLRDAATSPLHTAAAFIAPLRRRSSSSSSTASHPHQHDDVANSNSYNSNKYGNVLNVFERSRQSSVVSNGSCEGMTDDGLRDLWLCMLDLQGRYGCYNSTRMDLAMDAGEEGMDLMPNRFIIDVLNDSIIDLPEEGWAMLKQRLACAPAN